MSQKLIKCIARGFTTNEEAIMPFRKIFHELTSVNGVIMKGDKLYIPNIEITPGAGSLQRLCVELAH